MPTLPQSFSSDYYTLTANGTYTVSFTFTPGYTQLGETVNIGLFATGNNQELWGNNLNNYPVNAWDNVFLANYPQQPIGIPITLTYSFTLADTTYNQPYFYLSIYLFTRQVGSYTISGGLFPSVFTLTGPGVTDDGPIDGSGSSDSSSSTGSNGGSEGGTGAVTSNPSAGSQSVITPNSGGTAMSVFFYKAISEEMKLSNAGPVFTVTFVCFFTGVFDVTYIYQNQATIGTPDYGDYIFNTGAEMYCSDTSAKINSGSPYVGTTEKPGSYHYSCTFSCITAERLDLTPTARPAIVQGGGIELTEVRRQDVNGNAIVNSVGDYYEGLPNFYIPGSEFTISFNLAANPAALAQTYSFSTNSSAIWGQDAYAGVIGKITYQNIYEVYAGVLIEYWKITIPIRFRNDGLGWNFQPFDYGYRYKSGGSIVNYVDETTGIYGPVFLDGSGNLLNGNGSGMPQNPVIYPQGSGSDPDGYQTLNGLDWGALGIPVDPFQ